MQTQEKKKIKGMQLYVIQ